MTEYNKDLEYVLKGMESTEKKVSSSMKNMHVYVSPSQMYRGTREIKKEIS